eukprot:CAMPEP_0115858234 /NCGR_PEP_ID=MMETSP0287-20121206/15992_1 /TAXON_ID=412157 /ORGANISM="Chrysochromulina rotalis, Strain UIO044" /LENGTH=217 /DNA_ID=CAMNT_0003312491 /DNA_START=18 /DNA_END=671 /DNA_ORIENTATION=+
MPGVPKTKIFECAAARGLDLAFVSVLISGTVSMVNMPTSLGVSTGDKVQLSFLMLPTPTDRIANDGSGVHVMDGVGAYPICNETLAVSVGDSKLRGAMGAALPATEFAPLSVDTFMSLVSKRPVNDGLYISPSATAAKSLPLLMSGVEGLYAPEWNLDFNFVYDRGTWPSLHMHDVAANSYSSKGAIKGEFSLSTTFATNTVLEATLDSIVFDVPKE